MVDRKRIDEATGTETVGHEWDGIEELDTPMPRWWLWTFFATVVFAIGYMIMYPAWPLLSSATAGALHWSSREQLDKEMAAEANRRRPVMIALAQTPIEQLPDNAKLMNAAIQGGAAAFRVNCVQCHGAGAAGGKGYPNLNDDDWLWGGDLQSIHQTLQHGIRYAPDQQTRQGMMPAFGRDGLLQPAQINDVANYVLSLSHKTAPNPSTTRGSVVFGNTCAVCHGADAKGGRQFGAPNLTDQIWLYGGDKATVVETITNGRAGVMPAWSQRLDPVTVKMLAAYVHSLGGGEKFVPAQQAQADAKAASGKPQLPAEPNATR